VLDVKDGVVVRGVAGRRHDYRPIVSQLTSSCQPVDVARAIIERFGFNEFYVADLDAIAGQPAAFDTFRALQALGCRLWVDAGIRQADQAAPLLAAGVARIVLGLETIAGPHVLQVLRGQPVIFSLDLKEGVPLGDTSRWRSAEPGDIVAEAVAAGAGSVIVLDLACVGVGQGTGTEELCRALAARHSRLEIIAGGGVRGPDDLHRLQAAGVHGVLVASALHDGQITPEMLFS
jgi:phosphoribosylformimino-5-aminoimidazole carboxamide ribotide isomerase